MLDYQVQEILAAIDNYYATYKKTLTDAIQSQANRAIDEIITSMGVMITPVQRTYLSDILLNMLMGDDGSLDYGDVAEKRIQEIWGQLRKAAEDALKSFEGFSLEDILAETYGSGRAR